MIDFEARLHRPIATPGDETWNFLRLPIEASERLPARGMVSVAGEFNGVPFQVTLDPDGEGGHWMKVDPALQAAAGANVGDDVAVAITPCKAEPEPKVPSDLQLALEANPKAMATWLSTTAIARRDWIQWITSGKKAETRAIRIEKGCDKLAKGSRRPCCFDRSGMYDKSLSCPLADE